MQKFAPCPPMIRKPLYQSGRFSPSKLFYKIPVKLKKVNCANQPPFNLGKTLRTPNQPTQPFSKYTIKILNIHRLNITHNRNPINNQSLFAHQTTMRLNLYELPIINQPKRKT